jgi:hypothetical protein
MVEQELEMTMTKRWQHGHPVNLKCDGRTYEQRLWDDYALALVFPRRVPEWIDDAEVSARLRKLAATEVLPWSHSPDEEFLLAGEEK